MTTLLRVKLFLVFMLSWAATCLAQVELPSNIQVLPYGENHLLIMESLDQKAGQGLQTSIFKINEEGKIDEELAHVSGGFSYAAVDEETLYLFRRKNYSTFTLGDTLLVNETREYRIPFSPFYGEVDSGKMFFWGAELNPEGRAFGYIEGNDLKGHGSWKGQFIDTEGLLDLQFHQFIRLEGKSFIFGIHNHKLLGFEVVDNALIKRCEFADIERFNLFAKAPYIIYWSLNDATDSLNDINVAKLDIANNRLIDNKSLKAKGITRNLPPAFAGVDNNGVLSVFQIGFLGSINAWHGELTALEPIKLDQESIVSGDVVEGLTNSVWILLSVLAVTVFIFRQKMNRDGSKEVKQANELFPRRCIALMVDLTISSIFIVIGVMSSTGETFSFSNIVLSLTQETVVAIAFGTPGYFFVMEAMTSRTIGKRLMGLMVVHTDGRRLTIGGAFLRNSVRFIDQQPGCLYLVGLFSMFFNREGMRLGDLIAQTKVIDARSYKPEPYHVDERA